MRIKRPKRTSSEIAGVLGVFATIREEPRKRRISGMTIKGIRKLKRFSKPGRMVFEEARKNKKIIS